ncbi:MAG TPA: hypothetical protein DEF33_09400 [Clostridiales bacterium]|nr:hypothetical protein [Clostridiales bacterium]
MSQAGVGAKRKRHIEERDGGMQRMGFTNRAPMAAGQPSNRKGRLAGKFCKAPLLLPAQGRPWGKLWIG